MAKPVKPRSSARPYRVRDEAAPPSDRQVLVSRLGWLTLAAVWLFIAAGLLTFDRADAPSHAVWPANAETRNITGPIGAHLAYHLLRTLGWAIAIPMLFAAVAVVRRAMRRPVRQLIVRTLGVALLTAAAAAMLGVLFPRSGPLPGLPGGTIGLVAAAEMLPRFAVAGTLVWLSLLILVGLIVTCDRLVFAVPRAIWRAMVPAARVSAGAAVAAAGSVGQAALKANAAADRAGESSRAASGGLLAGLGALLRRAKVVRLRPNDLDDEIIEVKQPAAKAAKPRRVVRPVPQPLEEDEIDELDEAAADYDDSDADEDAGYEDEEEDAVPGAPQVFDRDKLRAKIQALPVRFAQANKAVATDQDLADIQNWDNLDGYKFPTLELLEEPEEGFNLKLESLVREQAENLEAAMRQYRIDGEVVDIESGPAITLYHIRLAPGTKVAQLTAISSDLARSLKAVNIRIVSNMEGRDTVGVEVPNPTKERVRLKELMSNRDRFAKMKLPMFLGKDAGGEPLIADLTKMPHMLIAGTTGSGKSVCMNTIIMSFLYTKKPNELKLVLVDPKMVEMSQFKDIPHLMCPVVTEMSKAAAILEWAVTKMDERYELLAEAGCRDIAGYNEMDWEDIKEAFNCATDEEAARIPRKLPYMVFIIDELADLMMTNKEVEGSIIRIAQKARAVGIHLILATQRPQANVVTGLIKSNMPCRIAFKVASGMDSRIVLDQKGGELLLGQGDMLYLSPSSHKLNRCQGTLVDDKEIRKVVKFLKEIAAPSFERSLMQMRGPGGSDEERILASENNSSASLAAAQEDPMFDRAVEIVLETGRGSVSLLQRRLAIGYTRASRLIDLMGIAGIIGEHKGSVAREVMMSVEEWQEIQRMVAEEAQRRGITLGSGTPRDAQDPHQNLMFDADAEQTGEDEQAPFDTDDEAAVEVNAKRLEAQDEDDADEEEDDILLAEDELDEEDEDEDEDEDEVEEEDDTDEEPLADSEEDEEDEDLVAEDEDEEEEEEEEDEVEYEYVDEDGNPIDPDELAEYEVDAEEEEEEEDAAPEPAPPRGRKPNGSAA
ncbi:MAG: DNA translocase FtsK 4TM domain-containing protein [Phycisphaerales bacterium]|nr:DNA translocase FtsK 4TM domain-containing protein [Planctomycetota bacterium]MCH8509425.1 DNA translocase FtsK 4TM domain-containing protein [Phycisphaerales bacterium]